MVSVAPNAYVAWRLGGAGWTMFVAVAALLAYLFSDAIGELLRLWTRKEEYSHGFFIPLISAYLVWGKRNALRSTIFEGSWWGLPISLVGVALFVVGDLSTLYIIVHYSMLIVLFGLLTAYAGGRGIRLVWVALAFLVFMIPLPPFLYNKLSGVLQLISSQIGVEVIRLFGISVFLEGNVIDLGEYKLQVVEACDGLRYLFPLMSFGFICAYLFKAPFWKRAIVFLSTIPIAILMNSFRIGVIGVLVENWGSDMAEGFLHQFEGWVIFMSCLAVLLGEIWLLARLSKDQQRFSEVFGLEATKAASNATNVRVRPLPPAFVTSVAALVFATAGTTMVGDRAEAMVQRMPFSEFPMKLAEWEGSRTRLDNIYLDFLDLTDYLIANYRNPDDALVNFYVAYYATQRKGESAHSPQSCIPGGGWEITRTSTRPIDAALAAAQSLRVNRVEIQRGDSRQLVYYWFQQRGRILTSEYLVKWYLLWDALIRNRTDGALVRLTTVVAPGENWDSADARLSNFARLLEGEFSPYLPN